MISIITPTYNRPSMLAEAIESVLMQSHSDWEMIIINDGSSEDYISIKDKYLTNKKIRWFDVEHGGCPAALNFGIKQSKGDFICILADDDLLNEANSLSGRMEAFEFKTDVVYTGFMTVNAENKIMSTFEVEAPDKDKIFQKDYINIQSMMWRSRVHNTIGHFSEDLINNEDWEWKIKCVMECKMKALPMHSVRTRYHGNNKSMTNRNLTNECAGILMERMKAKYGK